MGKKRNTNQLGLEKSVSGMESRWQLAGDPQADLRILVLEFAGFALQEKGVTKESLRGQLEAMYDVMLVHHPIFAGVLKSYEAHRKGTKPIRYEALTDNLSAEVVEEITALTSVLVQAELDYLGRVNTFQQVASDVLSTNITFVRKAGRKIRRNIANDELVAYLKLHDDYLKQLMAIEKGMQTCIDAVSEEKDGSESYKKSCHLLVGAIKKVLRGNHGGNAAAGQVRGEKQQQFLESISSKFKNKVTEAVIGAVLPELYAAIQPGISEAQMQAVIQFAEQVMAMHLAYQQVSESFNQLKSSEKEALMLGGVKLQSPYDYVMAVVCNPMQMANEYCEDHFGTFMQAYNNTKSMMGDVVSTVYTLGGLVVSPFTLAVNYFSAPTKTKTYFSSIAEQAFSSFHLNEAAYCKGMDFYLFIRSLGGVDDEMQKKNLFNHYFTNHDAVEGLAFDDYLAHEVYFEEVKGLFNEDGTLRVRKENDDESSSAKYFMALLVRVEQCQTRLSGAMGVHEVELIKKEVEGYDQALAASATQSAQAFNTQYLAPKLRVIAPMVVKQCLLPMIHDVLDSGKAKKDDPNYAVLGEFIELIAKHKMLSLEQVTAVMAQYVDEARIKSFRRACKSVYAWVDAESIHVIPDVASAATVDYRKSIMTPKRIRQQTLDQTLQFVRPKRIIEAIIAHLEKHRDQCVAMRQRVGDQGVVSAYGNKIKYCEAVIRIFKMILEKTILKNEDNEAYKALAKWLNECDTKLPTYDDVPGKREMAKFLLRVADEFGPISGGAGESIPLIEKIMHFVLSHINNDDINEAVALFRQALLSRDDLSRQQANDDLTPLWFDDAAVDPFDFSTQGGDMTRAILKFYLASRVKGVPQEKWLDWLNGMSGWQKVVDQVKYFLVSNGIVTEEKFIDFVCYCIGVEAKTSNKALPYLQRLAHAFFKIRAMKVVNEKATVETLLTVLDADGAICENPLEFQLMCDQIQSLDAFFGAYEFSASTDLEKMINHLIEDKTDVSRHCKIQVVLMHLECVRIYASRCPDEALQLKLFMGVMTAVDKLSSSLPRSAFTDIQISLLNQLRREGQASTALAHQKAVEDQSKKLNAMASSLQQSIDDISKTTLQRSTLNWVWRIGFYVVDAGSTAYSSISNVWLVMGLVTAIKGLSAITFQALGQVLGAALVATPWGAVLLGARFLVSLGWQIYRHRAAFRKDWQAGSTLHKVGVIAKYAGMVLLKATLATFVSNLVVDRVVATLTSLDVRQLAVGRFIAERWDRRAKRVELKRVKASINALKETADDQFDEKAKAVKEGMGQLKYNQSMAGDLTQQLEAIVQAHERVVKATMSTAKMLSALPSEEKASSAAPKVDLGVDWPAFVEARRTERYLAFAFDATQSIPLNDFEEALGQDKVGTMTSSVVQAMGMFSQGTTTQSIATLQVEDRPGINVTG